MGSIKEKVFAAAIEQPGSAAALLLFASGFAVFSINAIFSQSTNHPAPIWATTDSMSVSSLETLLDDQAGSGARTHTVLTQPISLRNVPVPKINPSKSRTDALHSSLVREVQAELSAIGLYAGKVDGIFGDYTKRAIMTYQEKTGMIPDGEASYSLLANMKAASAVARVQNSEVKPEAITVSMPDNVEADKTLISKIQTGLRDIYGDDTIVVDGLMGSQTRKAIREFQERFKLEANGKLDQPTISKLSQLRIITAI
ncbi:MAG: peptidoglycan-binding protein [Pseudomonadota bacterium]